MSPAVTLDGATLALVLICALTVALGLLSFAWLRMRPAPALGVLCCAYVLWIVGVSLFVERDRLAPFLTIDLANVAVILGFALLWASLRIFAGRSVSAAPVIGGAVLWLVACRIPDFYGSTEARVILASALIAGYSIAGACEAWRSGDQLIWRGVATAILALQGAILTLRIPAALLFGDSAPQQYWIAALGLWWILTSFAAAFLLLAMVRERAEAQHRFDATIDPLTGIANRRAFFDSAEAAVKASLRRGRPLSALLLDLDGFKGINDTFGHPAGDAILQTFCAVTAANLRSTAIFGRLGGEEFGIVLPDTDAVAARAVAERVVHAVAEARTEIDGRAVSTTVSIGVAGLKPDDVSFSDLLSRADKALYRAKELGRNQAAGPLAARPDRFAAA